MQQGSTSMARGSKIYNFQAIYFKDITGNIFRLINETDRNQFVLLRLTGKYRVKILVPSHRLTNEYKQVTKEYVAEHYPDIKL